MNYFGRKSSGVFIPSDKGYREVVDVPDNHSINDLTLHFGYNLDQVETTMPKVLGKSKIHLIAFEVFTRNIVYIMTDRKVTFLTEKDISKELQGFSVNKHYDSLRIKHILETGIENETLSVDYLAKVLKLVNVSRNGMFYAIRIKAYLYFTNGLLTNYQYNDGLFPWAKHLQEVNKWVFEALSGAACKYRADDDFLAQKEINMQCEAWGNIPDAFDNEFVSLHWYENKYANLYMLRVVHYQYPITKAEFMELNYGRFQVMENVASGECLLRHNRFDYRFSEDGSLLNIQRVYLI